MDDENVSMDELRAMLGSTNAVTSIPYELRPVGEIEGSQSRPGVPGDEGPVDTAGLHRGVSTVDGGAHQRGLGQTSGGWLNGVSGIENQ